jgi:hypothetical protein
MIKEIELEAALPILNRVEASGLPCKWNGEVLIVTVDCDSADEMKKLGEALSVSGKITFKTLKMWDNGVELSKVFEHLAKHTT